MDRSPGFGSMAGDSYVLFTLAFASAPYLKYLTLPHAITRRTVLQKVRRRTFIVLRQLVHIFHTLFTQTLVQFLATRSAVRRTNQRESLVLIRLDGVVHIKLKIGKFLLIQSSLADREEIGRASCRERV